MRLQRGQDIRVDGDARHPSLNHTSDLIRQGYHTDPTSGILGELRLRYFLSGRFPFRLPVAHTMSPAFATPAALHTAVRTWSLGAPALCPTGRRRGSISRGVRASPLHASATLEGTSPPTQGEAFTGTDAVTASLHVEESTSIENTGTAVEELADGESLATDSSPVSDTSPAAAFAATDALLSEDEFVPDDPLPDASPPPPAAAPAGKKVRLQALLSKAGVASSETCGLLVRAGLVRVNREKVTDPLARVRDSDRIEVRGKLLGAESDGEMRLPRAQRDLPARDIPSRYSRQVDRGFFAKRTAHKRR